jgi:hypothetical protein
MPETNHVVHQGTRRYDQLADFGRLSARVAELKGKGLTAADAAAVLNDEGFRTPRGGAYNRHRVYRLFGYLRQSNTLPGARPEDGPQRNEWWVQNLAGKLGVEVSRLRQWRLHGFIRWRKLPGNTGRIIVSADRSELTRLRQLSSYCQNHPDQPIPKTLATPKRSNTTRKTPSRSEGQ